MNCFGASADLPDDGDLYTVRDILAACQRLHELSPGVADLFIAGQIAEKVRQKWVQCNPELVLISDLAVKNKIVRDMKAAQNIKAKKASKVQVDNFMYKLDRLFDILCCRCPFVDCSDMSCQVENCSAAHINCECLRRFKIPVLELEFVKDQRLKVGHRGNLQIGQPDIPEAVRQQTAKDRVEQEKLSNEKQILANTPPVPVVVVEDDPSDQAGDGLVDQGGHGGLGDSDCIDDPDFIIGEKKCSNSQNRINIMPFIAEVERYFVSDRAASALFNAALKCVGVIKADDTKNVADKSKIVRGRALYRAIERKKDHIQSLGGLKCIGVDGKRDKKTKCVVIEVINGKKVEKRKVATEEHETYTIEPSGNYLTHTAIPPGKGTGRDLANDFVDVLAENESKDTLVAIVADGTAVNTGWKDGFIGHVERDLKARFLWLICMLHGNELPLRHLFCHCDGGLGTSGPDSFKGPLGKECKEEVHLKDVVNFEAIPTTFEDISDDVLKDLSRDQKILYQYTKAIQSGHVSDRLAAQVAGPIDHSRWLTLGIRLEILYTRTENPSEGLKMIVTYICQVYVPMWFSIKCHSKFTQGPAHLFKLLQLVKGQPTQVQELVKPHIQRNAYFAEAGIMLTAMLEDDEEDVRKFGVKLVKKARQKPLKPPKSKYLKGIRKHEISELNWNASSWKDIIDWGKTKVWQPRILEALTMEQIEAAVHTPIHFPKYPCHSQTVERMVKLVTEVSSSVFGEERQQDKIVSILASRKSRKAYDTKKDYKVA